MHYSILIHPLTHFILYRLQGALNPKWKLDNILELQGVFLGNKLGFLPGLDQVKVLICLSVSLHPGNFATEFLWNQ